MSLHDHEMVLTVDLGREGCTSMHPVQQLTREACAALWHRLDEDERWALELAGAKARDLAEVVWEAYHRIRAFQPAGPVGIKLDFA